MSNIIIDNEAVPGTPASGYATVYVDSTSKELAWVDDTGKAVTARPITNASTGDGTATSNQDNYLVGSAITIPPQKVRAGTTIRWRMVFSKASGAGTSASIWKLFGGTLGTTGDTLLITFTAGAQSNAADAGWVDICMVVQTASSSGVVEGTFSMYHNLATTGLNAAVTNIIQLASGTFNLTTAALIFGISCNPGASSQNFTFQIVTAELLNC